MRALIAALILAAAPGFASESSLSDLTSGQYELKVSGMLCWACARAIAAQLSKISSVDGAKPDFAHQAIDVSVKRGRTLKVTQIDKALSRAERQVNLGGHYDVTSAVYQVQPILPAPK